jgi:SulP family sulfate permease
MSWKRYLPILDWGRGYNFRTLADDAVAAVVVTVMLVPQSLAYAMLAGLPPEAGLYASITPLIAYAMFGTSRALAVGPVAVISLMTAAGVGRVVDAGVADYGTAALTLAFMSGTMLLALGLFRLGALANFLSHPVISGFIIASAVLIAASQIGPATGASSDGQTLPEIVGSLIQTLDEANLWTFLVGATVTAFLIWNRKSLRPLLVAAGASARTSELLVRTAPALVVVISVLAVSGFGLSAQGVAVVGEIPKGLPPFTTPVLNLDLWIALAVPAALISVIGFVESVSVAQTLAARRRERIEPNQELIALGASNLAAGMYGGFPVTGGFARSVVNFDAGARTPAAGAFTAIGILIVAFVFTPLLYDLPKTTLAAIIIVSVLSIVDLRVVPRALRVSRADFAAIITTIVATLLLGVETGVVAGVVLSLVLHLNRTSTPHSAIVGQAPGTEHFRNIERHNVITSPHVLTLRVDESLYFANARFLEDRISSLVAQQPELKHVVLMCPAVNHIDASALESLEAINQRLKDAGVTFHLSEVKGPVMDRLKRSRLLEHLTGRVFLTQFGAMMALDPDVTQTAAAATADECFLAERNGGQR